MIAVDHAPAIAAFLAAGTDITKPPRTSADYAAEIRAAWPDATPEEIGRGTRIALELIDMRLAELRAEEPPAQLEPEPARRAVIVAGVAEVLRSVENGEDFPAAVHRAAELYPDLTWSTFQEAVTQAGNLWPAGEGDTP